MNKLLTKKWLGFVFVATYALCVASLIALGAKPFLEEYTPTVLAETNQFLPITIENGEITYPVDTVITKTYQFDKDETMQLVLDTRIDEFPIDSLKQDGIFISKKCIYMPTPDETKRRCFNQIKEPITFTQEKIEKAAEFLEKYLGSLVFLFIFFGILAVFYIAIALYTCLMHWIIVGFFKGTPFSQTLFINTLVYMLIQLLEFHEWFSFNSASIFVLMLATNFVLCSRQVSQTKEQPSDKPVFPTSV